MRAALYCRISNDKAGAGLGVERQRADCEALASTLGWTVAAVHTDNDLSAFSGKARPGYVALLDDLKAGRVDAVVAWHPDRLYRHPTDLEGFINAVESAGAAVRTVSAGEMDLSTPSGRMVARMLGAAARHEVEHAQERMRRKQRELREHGRPTGGCRVFGYRPGGMTVDEREADAIRSGARMVLVGQRPAAVAREWNTAGIATSTGGRWRGTSVARVLTRPRYARLVEHDGHVVRNGEGKPVPGTWPEIIDQETHEGVRAVLGDGITPKGTYRPRVKLLLSGVAVCGYTLDDGTECGQPIVGAGSNSSGRRYRCATRKHIARSVEELNEHIEDIVLDLLPRPESVSLVAADRSSAAECHAEAAAIVARRKKLGVMFADGQIDGATLRAGTERTDDLMAEVDEKLSALTAGSALDGIAGRADAAQVWQTLSVDRKRAVIDALMTITLLPSKRGGHGGTRFNPDTVRVEPRF